MHDPMRNCPHDLASRMRIFFCWAENDAHMPKELTASHMNCARSAKACEITARSSTLGNDYLTAVGRHIFHVENRQRVQIDTVLAGSIGRAISSMAPRFGRISALDATEEKIMYAAIH